MSLISADLAYFTQVSLVAHGSVSDRNDDGGRDPYEGPKQMGIYVELPSQVQPRPICPDLDLISPPLLPLISPCIDVASLPALAGRADGG